MATQVILDTNIWVSELGLRSASGAALLHTIRLAGGRLAIPEPVEMELPVVLLRRASQSRELVENNLGLLRTICGSSPAVQLPTDAEIESSIAGWLEQMGNLVQRIPITEVMAREAVARAVVGHAPSHKKEQVRDDMIWLSALELSAVDRVVFVTADGDFREKGELHPDLVTDIADRGGDLEVVRSVPECLRLIADEAEALLDRDSAAARILDSLAGPIDSMLDDHGFRRIGANTTGIDIYATERPSHLAVNFSYRVELEDEYTEYDLRLLDLGEQIPFVRTEAVAVVTGSTFLNADHEPEDATIDRVSFEFMRGGELQKSQIVRVGTATGGRRNPLEQRRRLFETH